MIRLSIQGLALADHPVAIGYCAFAEQDATALDLEYQIGQHLTVLTGCRSDPFLILGHSGTQEGEKGPAKSQIA